MPFYLFHAHAAVKTYLGARKPAFLTFSGILHPLPYGCRILIFSLSRVQFPKGYRRRLRADIKPFQYGPGYMPQISFNLILRTITAVPVRIKSAWTQVHGSYHHEICRKFIISRHPCHRDFPFLQRLSQYFHRGTAKMGQLIQKKYARQTSRSITIIETLPSEKVRYDHISKAIPTGYYLLPWGRGNYPVLPHHKTEG